MPAPERLTARVQAPLAPWWEWRRASPPHLGHRRSAGRTGLVQLQANQPGNSSGILHFIFLSPPGQQQIRFQLPVEMQQGTSPAEAVRRSYPQLSGQDASRWLGAGSRVATQATRPGTSTSTDPRPNPAQKPLNPPGTGFLTSEINTLPSASSWLSIRV